MPKSHLFQGWEHGIPCNRTQQKPIWSIPVDRFMVQVERKTALFTACGEKIERGGRHAEARRRLELWKVVLEQDLGQCVVVDAMVDGERHLPRERRIERELLAARRKHEDRLNTLARDLLVLYSIPNQNEKPALQI